MDNNSDSDKSYDKISWDEFGISVSESDSEESTNGEKLLNDAMDNLDLNKSASEQNKDMKLTEENFSGNSSYDDGSVDGDSVDSVEFSDPENDDLLDLFAFSEPEDVVLGHRRRGVLLVPGMFAFPTQFKSRKDTEIKDLVKAHALPFLPAKSLARFKAVSKEWNQWISSPFLAHKQSYLFRNLSGFFCQVTNNTAPTYISVDKSSSDIRNSSLSFLPESVVIRSTCYGLLLCQAIRDDNDYYVCNPVNTEYRKIPKPNFYHGNNPAIVLAFEPSEINIQAHFELICAVPVIDNPIVYFEIYSSKTKSWRLSSAECIEVEDSKMLGGGFYVNKIVYFMTDSGNVLGFDVKSEICGVLSLPSKCESNGVLSRIDGEFTYVHACHNPDENDDESEYDLSVYVGMDMKIKSQIGLVLNSLQVGPGTECRVLPFVTNNGDVVAILARKALWLYHMRENRGEVIGRVWNFEAKYLPFVSSLVHLPPE